MQVPTRPLFKPSSVIPGFEKLIHEPIPSGTILLAGPPGSGKSTFTGQFLAEGLKRGEPCLAVVTDMPPAHLIRSLEERWLVEARLVRKLRILDCYSWRLGMPSQKQEYPVVGNLTALMVEIEKLRREMKRGRLALDSLSTLALDSGLQAAREFFNSLRARMLEGEMLSLVTLEQEVHTLAFERTLSYLAENVIKLKLIEEKGRIKRYIRVLSSRVAHSTSWFPYEVTDRGFLIRGGVIGV